MRKRVTIAGRSYDLSSNAYTPIAYKQEFGKDYFQDLFQMVKGQDLLVKKSDAELDSRFLADFDMTFFHRLFWVFAKSANPKVKPFEDFFMDMEEFPIDEVGPVLMEMLNQGMTTRKKQTVRKKRVRTSSR